MEQGWPGLAQYTPAVPADWSPRPRTVQDALDQLGGRSGGAGAATSYVWKPGGVASPGVYITWATLVAAFALVPPASRKIVAVDDSLGAAHITTGAWANCDNVEFTSGGLDSGPGLAVASIIVDQGATLSGCAHMRIVSCNLEYNATSGAFITTLANINFSLVLEQCALTGAGGGGNGFISAGAGSTIALVARTSELAGQLFAGTATSIFDAELEGIGSFGAGVVNMTAGAVVSIAADGSFQVDATQTPAPTITIVDPTPTLIYAEGGTAAGNTYVTQASLKAALLLFQGPKTILVDDSASPGNATLSGDWATGTPLEGCTLVPQLKGPATGVLNLADGLTLAFTTLVVDEGLEVSSNANTSPIIVNGAGAFSQIILRAGSVFQSTTATAAATLTNGTLNVFADDISQIGDATHPALSAAAGKTIRLFLSSNSTVEANALAGLGTVNVAFDSTTAISTTQTVTTLTLSYKQPPNFVKATAVVGSGTHTVSITTANIQRKGSGIVDVQGDVSGISAAADSITATLLRDATVLRTKTITTSATALDYDCAMSFLDTLPDNAVHTYSIQLAGAQNNTVAANGGYCGAAERH